MINTILKRQKSNRHLNDYLVISALGEDHPGIVDQLSKDIFNVGCNIVDSRMTVLGGDFAIILLVSGNSHEISQLEKTLPGLQEKLALTITARRTAARTPRTNMVSYAVRAVSIDHPGIVHQLASFFSGRGINIENLNTNSYAAAHTGTRMFSIDMMINVPAEAKISRLREDLIAFCDDLNIDVSVEPR